MITKHGKRKWMRDILKVTNGVTVEEYAKFIKKAKRVLSLPIDPSKFEN